MGPHGKVYTKISPFILKCQRPWKLRDKIKVQPSKTGPNVSNEYTLELNLMYVSMFTTTLNIPREDRQQIPSRDYFWNHLHYACAFRSKYFWLFPASRGRSNAAQKRCTPPWGGDQRSLHVSTQYTAIHVYNSWFLKWNLDWFSKVILWNFHIWELILQTLCLPYLMSVW